MAILVVFGSIEGQSEKIADFIANLATKTGQQVEIFDTADLVAEVDWGNFETVALVASVHERRHPKAFEVFLSSHKRELSERKVLLISVSLRVAFEEGQEEAQDYLDEMKLRTGINPDRELLVAGAIRSRSYDYFATQILSHVVLRGHDFDPTEREHEFTDWSKLDADVRAFLN